MKKLARWTIGPVSKIGFDILLESLKLFSKIYPEIDRVVCFNNIDVCRLKYIKNFADLLEQKGTDVNYPLTPPDSNIEEATGCGWKLSPPRIEDGSYELFIDNDLIIRERLETIDRWLGEKSGLISEGQGRRRMYGAFDHLVPDGVNVCAGLFGLPPYFDFLKAIKEKCLILNGSSLGGFNEQGLTASIITCMSNYLVVPKKDLIISEDHVDFPSELPKAIHFVGANRKPWHRGWKSYKNFLLKLN
jgi:hypothetical protein